MVQRKSVDSDTEGQWVSVYSDPLTFCITVSSDPTLFNSKVETAPRGLPLTGQEVPAGTWSSSRLSDFLACQQTISMV